MTHAETRCVGKRRPLEILSPAEVQRLHEASLKILAEVGCTYHSQAALAVLAEHGAQVDRETTVAKLPPELVQQALTTLPRSFVLGGRTPEYDLPLDGEHAYLTADGCAVLVREADGTVRASRKADIADAARLVQRLPNISATSAIVSAQDYPEQTRVLHEFDACLRNAEKHSIVVSMKDAREARWLIEMATAAAGGSRELAARPPFSVILCTVSPLHQERFGMDLAFALAQAGIPFLLYPMPILGATAPVTPAGTAVVEAAEVLATVTAVQLACPGAKIIHAGGPTALDMRTGSYFAAVPESILLRAVQTQMAAFYGMPTCLGYGGTNAKEPGAQAAWENALTLAVGMLAGADFAFGCGLLDGSQIFAPEQLVIDDEVFGIVTRLLRGVGTGPEQLAEDLIKQMGFDGHYLFNDHTRAHVRELWQSRLGGGGTYAAWQARGAPSTTQQARAAVDDLLAAPATEFPADLGRELDRIISSAEAG